MQHSVRLTASAMVLIYSASLAHGEEIVVRMVIGNDGGGAPKAAHTFSFGNGWDTVLSDPARTAQILAPYSFKVYTTQEVNGLVEALQRANAEKSAEIGHLRELVRSTSAGLDLLAKRVEELELENRRKGH